MPYQVDDALLHAMSGTELSRVRTELRLLPPEAYQPKSDHVERGRHCYAIKSSPSTSSFRLPRLPGLRRFTSVFRLVVQILRFKLGLSMHGDRSPLVPPFAVTDY